MFPYSENLSYRKPGAFWHLSRDLFGHDARIAPSETRKICAKIAAPTTPKF